MTNHVEEIASKAMGGVKAAKASLEGLTGVFRHLAQEHGEVTALLMRVKASNDPKVRAELFPEIRKQLLSHEKGELAVVYPAFREHSETQMMAEQHEREADELEKAIGQLTSIPVEQTAWKTQFDALVDLVSRHVREEENDFFPAGEKVLGSDTKELLTRYETTKSAVMEQLA